jgi:hypothetical protein
MLKQAALAACCAAGLAATPLAFGATSWGVTIGTGPVYYEGYYYPPSHCWRDYYDDVVCSGRPYSNREYYNGYYYNEPSIHLEYHNGRYGWHDRYGYWHDRDDDDR